MLPLLFLALLANLLVFAVAPSALTFVVVIILGAALALAADGDRDQDGYA